MNFDLIFMLWRQVQRLHYTDITIKPALPVWTQSEKILWCNVVKKIVLIFNPYWSLVKSDDSGLKRLSPHKQEPISWQPEHLVLPPDTMLLSRKTLMNAYITSILVQLTPDKTTHCIAHLASPSHQNIWKLI